MEKLKSNIFYNYPFKLQFLKENFDEIDWSWTIWNKNIDWTIEHLELIEDKIKSKFRRNDILRNTKIASNQKIIFHYFDRLNKSLLHENQGIIWNEEFIDQLSDKIDLTKISGLLDVSLEFIEKNREKLNWDSLSRNTKIDWNTQFIKKNKELINWSNLSFTYNQNWGTELIDEFQDYWNWKYLSQNPKVGWTLDLINKYQHKLDWERLSYNSNAVFTIKYVEDNKDKIDFHGLSKNKKIEWSEAFIDKHENNLKFGNYGLSWNSSLPWSKKLIEKYKDKWSWSGISANHGISWTEEILDHFSKELIWGKNDNIEKGSADSGHRRNGFCLSNNPKLPWSIELINKYEDRLSSIATNLGIWDKVIKPILTTEEKVKEIIKKKN